MFVIAALRSRTERLAPTVSNKLKRNARLNIFIFKIFINQFRNDWTVLISRGTANTVATVAEVVGFTLIVVSFVLARFLIVVASDVANPIRGHCSGHALAYNWLTCTVTLILA